MFRTSRFFLIFLLLLLVSACARPPAVSTVQVPPDFDRILVVGFRDMTETAGEDMSIRCPLSGKVYVAGPVAPDAGSFLTTSMMNMLGNRDRFKLMSPEQVRDIQSQLLSGEGNAIPEWNLLVRTGRNLEADAVLVGHIYRFKDRVGGKFAVDSPASVAFDVHLIRMSDGRVLWSGQFDETQQALTENLFQLGKFLERDGQWVTAEQMALAGLEQVMERFNLQ